MRTRVGYAGGSTPEPTHKQMGDHTETVQVDFNPDIVSYSDILYHFWHNHNPNRKKYRDREYISLVLYHDEQQKKVAWQTKRQLEEVRKEKMQTEISPYKRFTQAIERQQKWHIKRIPQAEEVLKSIYSSEKQFIDSVLVARLNSLAKGYGSIESVHQEISEEDVETQEKLQDIIDNITSK